MQKPLLHILSLLLLTLCFFGKASAQTVMMMPKSPQMVLQGFYQGVNMYIQNPHSGKDSGFCVIKVLVNGIEIDTIKYPKWEMHSSAFDIPLTEMGFKEGDSIKIEILHHDDCKPKVIYNPPLPKQPVYFIETNADSSGLLKWKVEGEAYIFTYYIEQFRWNKWIRIGEVEGTGDYAKHEYSFKVTPHSGENQVRIKAHTITQYPTYSNVVKFTSKGYTCCDGYNKVHGKIVFSGETLYEVYNKEGQIIKKGFASEIDISDLSYDVYYLNYDNKTTEFVVTKKKK